MKETSGAKSCIALVIVAILLGIFAINPSIKVKKHDDFSTICHVGEIIEIGFEAGDTSNIEFVKFEEFTITDIKWDGRGDVPKNGSEVTIFEVDKYKSLGVYCSTMTPRELKPLLDEGMDLKTTTDWWDMSDLPTEFEVEDPE